MIKTLAGLLNGALLLATTAAFGVLGRSEYDLALVTYAPSVLLAFVSGFVAIGGLAARAAGQASHARLCALLSLAWTAVQIAFALILVRLLLPANWLTEGAGEAWILTAIVSQAILLAVLVRADVRVRENTLKL